MTNLLKGLLLVLLLAFFSCKDKDSLIGENFIEGNLEVHFDTITNVNIKTIPYGDSSKVKTGAVDALIGDYHDEYFGDHKAISLFNFSPESNLADFGENPQADSLVLVLDHKGLFYGYDTINSITITVYRITKSLSDINETVLSDIDLSQYYDSSKKIGEAKFLPGHMKKDQKEDTLRIKLNIELAQEFIENRDKIETDSIFFDFFQGIILKAERQDGTKGSIVTFHLSGKSYLELNFKNDNDTKQRFIYNTGGEGLKKTKRYNFFEHNYTTGHINNSITTPNPLTFGDEDSLIFFQAMRGLAMKISINMSDSEVFNTPDDIIINKAVLSLTPIHKGFEDALKTKREYATPKAMQLFELNENDNSIFKLKDYINKNSYYPQFRDKKSERYDIKLSQVTFEKIQKNQDRYTLWIRTSQPSVTPYRAVFYGAGVPDKTKRPKVVVYYSKKSN